MKLERQVTSEKIVIRKQHQKVFLRFLDLINEGPNIVHDMPVQQRQHNFLKDAKFKRTRENPRPRFVWGPMNLAKDVWSSPFVLRASKEILGWVNQSMWNAKYSLKSFHVLWKNA